MLAVGLQSFSFTVAMKLIAEKCTLRPTFIARLPLEMVAFSHAPLPHDCVRYYCGSIDERKEDTQRLVEWFQPFENWLNV